MYATALLASTVLNSNLKATLKLLQFVAFTKYGRIQFAQDVDQLVPDEVDERHLKTQQ